MIYEVYTTQQDRNCTHLVKLFSIDGKNDEHAIAVAKRKGVIAPIVQSEHMKRLQQEGRLPQ